MVKKIFLSAILVLASGVSTSYANDENSMDKASDLYDKGFQYEHEGNFISALEFYQKAADYNYPYALASLGDFYIDGKGVSKDYNKAKELFEKCAANKEFETVYYCNTRLGYLYYYGYGVEQSYQKAKEFFDIGASEVCLANIYLGNMYANGIGVKQDKKKAKEYYEEACDLGDDESCSKNP